MLAFLRLGRVQGRHVEHRQQLPIRREQRCGRAGQPDVRRIEVLGLMAGDDFLLDQARTDTARTRMRLVPVGAEVQPGRLELLLGGRVADVVDGDTVAVSQQHHVAEVGDATVHVFHAGAGDPDEAFQALLVLAHALERMDVRGFGLGRIQPVLLDATGPRLVNQRIGTAGVSDIRSNVDDVVDVLYQRIAHRSSP